MRTKSLIKWGRTATATAALAIVALGTTSLCHADQLRTNVFDLPTSIHAKVTSTGCDNSQGPEITLSGSIEVSAFKTKFTFQNNKRGKHTTNCVSECEA